MKKKREPKSAKDILMNNNFVDRFARSATYINREFQDFGIRLSHTLNDPAHKSLYIKLAKDMPRDVLETCASFAADYPTKEPNKGRVFMWKLKSVCQERNIPIRLSRKKHKHRAVIQNDQMSFSF